jgi:hypothetical protein
MLLYAERLYDVTLQLAVATDKGGRGLLGVTLRLQLKKQGGWTALDAHADAC